jgi:hypothetical protein
MKKIYFFLLALIGLQSGLLAQSPGGVSTALQLWLKADNTATLSPTTGSLNSWTYSNSTNQFTATVGSQPTVAPSTFNFLPSIAFNGAQMMSGPTGAGTPGAPIPLNSPAYAIFAVWSSPAPVVSGGPNMRVWAQRANAGAAGDNAFDGASLFVFPGGQFNGAPFFVTPSPYGDQPEISPYVTGVSAAPAYNAAILTYTPNTPYISELNLLNQNTNDLELMDQTNYATGPGVTSTDPAGNATANRKITDAGNFLGARSLALDEPFTGNLAELVVYSTNISAAQRSAIFSYLSLKWGIPLGGSYISSAGTTIWDAVANASYGFNSSNYNNFVFGVGQDNGSGLSTTQSNSLATGSGNGMGQSGMGNIVVATTAAMSDQNFLIVGSNNAGLTETTTNLPALAPAGSARYATQWVVQSTGNVGLVNLSFDFTGLPHVGSTIGTTTDFRLVLDNDGDGDFTTGVANQNYFAPSSFTGNVANFTGINLSGGLNNGKIVFAILSHAAGGTPLPVTWTSFTATPEGGNVNLNWAVSANQNASVYEVDHSTDGVNFAKIGEVANDPDIQSYGFTHSNAGAGMHYYRIQEVDLDGKSIYSQIVSANLSNVDNFVVRALNNPVVGSVQAEIEINAPKAGNASIEIWNLAGERLATQIQAVNSGTTRIPLAMMNGLASTSYVVKVKIGNVTQTLQIVKL